LVHDLVGAVSAFADEHTDKFVVAVQDNSKLLLTWIGYFEASISNEVCDELLSAIRSSLIEVAACCTIGLVRPALFSIRLQIELFLAWLYFNDHAMEWRSVRDDEAEFPMRRKNLQYLAAHLKDFNGKLGALREASAYTGSDPYQLLSSYVHGTSASTLPTSEDLKAVVESVSLVEDCVELQGAIAEYLSDVALVWFSGKWHDLPPMIQDSAKERLSAAKLKALCG